MAVALAKNPAGVLRLQNFPLDKVCDVPYLEPTDAVIHGFQAKTSSALATVNAPELQDRKKQCLAILMAP